MGKIENGWLSLSQSIPEIEDMPPIMQTRLRWAFFSGAVVTFREVINSRDGKTLKGINQELERFLNECHREVN